MRVVAVPVVMDGLVAVKDVMLGAAGGVAGDDLIGQADVARQRQAERTMVGEGLQGGLGHGVYRIGRGERLHVENVRSGRILGPGAGP
jgi:hypothetical protein